VLQDYGDRYMNTLLVLIALLIMATVIAVLWGAYELVRVVPADKRAYQDPVPRPLKLAWPLVNLGAYYFGRGLPAHRLERIYKKLQAAGLDYVLTAEQFVGVCFAAGLGGALLLWLELDLLKASDQVLILGVLLGALLGALYPVLWIAEKRARRRRRIIKDLSTYLDFITLSVEAGLNLTGALSQAAEKGPQGPLGQELARLLRDLRAGLPRADALRRLAERIDLPQISSLVGALVQADRIGASLGPTLRAQAAQRRDERFQRAEKLALEAPVKMMAPLVMFFFPLIFLLIAYFIAVKVMQAGLL
jgi:tight adherence protein C